MSSLSVLTTVFTKAKTQKELQNLLMGILTSKEREELVQRLEIVKLLKKGVSQHAIAEQLGVGVATVTRGSKEIQMGRFQYV